MAVFKNKILDAYFINQERSTIRVEYSDGGAARRGFILPRDEENADFQALEAEGWSVKRVLENTEKMEEDRKRLFNARVNEVAAGMMDAPINGPEEFSWDKILEKNADKDELFNFKMWALETEMVQNAGSDLKKQIRKARTVLEGLAILYNCT